MIARSSEAKAPMLDAKHCVGCENDFYNGHNPYGVLACWHRSNATLRPSILIHIDQAPPYRNPRFQNRPTCYKAKHFVTVKPDALDSEGYWRSR